MFIFHPSSMHFAAVKVMPFVPELRDRLNELKWAWIVPDC